MQNIMQYVYIAIVILISLSFHELAHAFISYRLGDPTAKNQGRLTLNPIKHLDVIGTIMMIASMIYGSGFGWAKPVPINPTYYKNRKIGTMLVSIAGPMSNLFIAFIFSFPLIYISSKYNINSFGTFDPKFMVFNISYLFFMANINLAVFNLLPVPPLDGSKILSGILPSRTYFKFLEYENYIGIAFILIIFIFQRQFTAVLNFITGPIRSLIIIIAESIMRLFL